MSVAEKLPAERLPVPVLEYPHWRVTYRPATYVENRIESLSRCYAIVSREQVRLRGWDFPYLPASRAELVEGRRWIGAWSNFMGHIEYWRFYQSTQFLYLGAVREVSEDGWREKLRGQQRFLDKPDISDVPGFVSITNLIFNVTEIFEFAARLSQAEVYLEPLDISIQLIGIRGFTLAADRDWSWPYAFAASEAELSFQQTFVPAELVASAADSALNCAVWFFERFGWLNPNVAAIKSEQQRLLERTY